MSVPNTNMSSYLEDTGVNALLCEAVAALLRARSPNPRAFLHQYFASGADEQSHTLMAPPPFSGSKSPLRVSGDSPPVTSPKSERERSVVRGSVYRTGSIALASNHHLPTSTENFSNRYDLFIGSLRAGVSAQRRREVPNVLPMMIGGLDSTVTADQPWLASTESVVPLVKGCLSAALTGPDDEDRVHEQSDEGIAISQLLIQFMERAKKDAAHRDTEQWVDALVSHRQDFLMLLRGARRLMHRHGIDPTEILQALMHRLAALDPNAWLPDTEWVSIGALFLYTYDGTPLPEDDTDTLGVVFWCLVGGNPLQRRLGLPLSNAIERRYREPVFTRDFLAAALYDAAHGTPKMELLAVARRELAHARAEREHELTVLTTTLDCEDSVGPSIAAADPLEEDSARGERLRDTIIRVWNAIAGDVGVESFIGVTACTATTSQDAALQAYLDTATLTQREDLLRCFLTAEALTVAGGERYLVSFDPSGARVGRLLRPGDGRAEGFRGGMRMIARIAGVGGSDLSGIFCRLLEQSHIKLYARNRPIDTSTSLLVASLRNSLRYMASQPVTSGPQQHIYGVGRCANTVERCGYSERGGRGVTTVFKVASPLAFPPRNIADAMSHCHPGRVIYFPGPSLGTASTAVKGWVQAQLATAQELAGTSAAGQRLAFGAPLSADSDMDDLEGSVGQGLDASSLVFVAESNSALLLGNYSHLPRAHDCIIGSGVSFAVRDVRDETVIDTEAADTKGFSPGATWSRRSQLGSTLHTTGPIAHAVRLRELDDQAALRVHLKSLLRVAPSAMTARVVWDLIHNRPLVSVTGGSGDMAWVLKLRSNEAPFSDALNIWGCASVQNGGDHDAKQWGSFVGMSEAAEPPPLPAAVPLLSEALRGVGAGPRTSPLRCGRVVYFFGGEHKDHRRYLWLDSVALNGRFVEHTEGGLSEEPISVRLSVAHPESSAARYTDADVLFLCNSVLPLSPPVASVAIRNCPQVSDVAADELLRAMCIDNNIKAVSLSGCRVNDLLQSELHVLAAADRVPSTDGTGMTISIRRADEWIDVVTRTLAMPSGAVSGGSATDLHPLAVLGRVLCKVPELVSTLEISDFSGATITKSFLGGALPPHVEQFPAAALPLLLFGPCANFSFLTRLVLRNLLLAEPSTDASEAVDADYNAWLNFFNNAPALRCFELHNTDPFPLSMQHAICGALAEQETKSAGGDVACPRVVCPMRRLVFTECTITSTFLLHLVGVLGPHSFSRGAILLRGCYIDSEAAEEPLERLDHFPSLGTSFQSFSQSQSEAEDDDIFTAPERWSPALFARCYNVGCRLEVTACEGIPNVVVDAHEEEGDMDGASEVEAA